MTKREELIQEVRNHKTAIKNDGSIEQLKEVLGLCFPDDIWEIDIEWGIFYASLIRTGYWRADNTTSLPTVSVKEFYEVNTITDCSLRIGGKTMAETLKKEDKFVWGEEVEVSNNNQIWFVRYYIAKSPRSNAHIAATIGGLVFGWKYIRKLPLKVKLTHQMIADKFGVEVDNIEIIK